MNTFTSGWGQQSYLTACVANLAAILFMAFSASAYGQSGEDLKLIESSIQAGEFSNAIRGANQLPAGSGDAMFGKIATAQFAAGSPNAAVQTAREIDDDRIRAESVHVMYRRRSTGGGDGYGDQGNQGSAGNQTRPNQGNRGGITAADFDPLIELIKSTIGPDDWDDTNGDGTIQAYPSGVLVDANGLIKRIKEQPGRDRAGTTGADVDAVVGDSGMRKISLTRLERECQLLAAQGLPPTEEMKYLGGITDIKFLMFLPETNDIVIAGPAGPWETGADGRVVNQKTGRPVLLLDDLVVCLRNAETAGGKFGCTINPRAENLARTKQFVATNQGSGKAWREELRQNLGRQDVEVFGIDPRTHAGRVIVEADYRMKLVGMGIEPSVPSIPSYLSRVSVRADGSLPPMDVVRWWFTLNYDNVSADATGNTFTFNGAGVKVLSENEMIDDQGNRIHTGKSKGPTYGFAKDFTEHFDEISDKYPVYRQLKNVFDLSLVAALIENRELSDRAKWNRTYFGAKSEFGFQPKLENVVREVDSVINHRVIRVRKKSSTMKHTLIGVSGGVRFDPATLISRANVRVDDSGTLDRANLESRPVQLSRESWNWD